MSPHQVKEAMDELCPESDSAEKHAVLQVLLPLFSPEQLPCIAPLLDEDLLKGLSGAQVGPALQYHGTCAAAVSVLLQSLYCCSLCAAVVSVLL